MRPIRTLTALAALGAAAVLAGGSFPPDPGAPSKLERKAFETLLDDGARDLNRARREDSTAQSLKLLRGAQDDLRRARAITLRRESLERDRMRRRVDPVLVDALVSEAEIHVGRNSLPRAKRLVSEALEVDPSDSSARNLRALLLFTSTKDLYDGARGARALERIRERRATSGPPARDRGVILRR